MSLVVLLSAAATKLSAESVLRGLTPEKALSDFALTTWTSEDGLPTDVLLDVMQTESGYLWVAGFGGLARFDGVAFETFDPTTIPGFGASSFYKVVEQEGRLWLATQDAGMWLYENGQLRPLSENQRPISVRTALVARSGTVFVGTADHGAFRVEDGELTPLGLPELSDVTIRALFEDRAGAIWFGTEEGGLVRLFDGSYETYRSATRVAGDSVTSLAEAQDGGLWIGTQNGLSRMQGDQIMAVPELAGVEIFGLAEDDYGSLWIAAEQGLFRRNGLTHLYERADTLQGKSLRSINTLAFDHEGSVWISSYTGGLIQLRDGTFKNYTSAEGLSGTRTNSVYVRKDGTVLVGGDGGAIELIDRGRVTNFDLRKPLSDVRVRSFLEDASGALWISSYAGLLKIQNQKETLFTTETGLPTNQIRFTYEDRLGKLWLGTRGGGLVNLDADGRVVRLVDRASGLSSDFVLALAEDESGNLLIGTQTGLNILDAEGSVTVHGVEDGLPGNLVFNIFVDDVGDAWLATAGGLARYREGRVDAITAGEGLPAEAVYDYTEDGHGFAWMSSNSGLIRIQKSQLEELLSGRRTRLEPGVFDETDGMTSRQCTGATRMAKGSDGRIWVPTLAGLSVIDPQALDANPIAPPVWIYQLTVDTEPIYLAESGDHELSIAPGGKRFTFSFSVLSYLAPSKVEVRYRLEGFDEDWIEAGLARSAIYTALSPGSYIFQVIAANDSGVWNRVGASLRVEIQPRYYETTYFLLLVAALLATLVWAFHKGRTRSLRRRSQRLEALLDEQQRLERERRRLIQELEARNDELEHLTYAISHDLKSPLYTIHGFLAMIDKDRAAGDEKRVEQDLDRIRGAVQQMSRLLAKLNKLWRLEHNENSNEEVDLGELAHQATASVERLLSERGIEVAISESMPTVRGDSVQLLEVLQNLVENAAKFMGDQAQPRIDIGFSLENGECVFFVKDNGLGIEKEYHDRIFQLFERLGTTPDGSGIGLAIVKRVITVHGGRIWVESEGSGKGTMFRFTLGTEEIQEEA